MGKRHRGRRPAQARSHTERACLLLSANKVVAADPCHGRVDCRKGVNTVNIPFDAKVRAKSSPIVALYFYLGRSNVAELQQREGVSNKKWGAGSRVLLRHVLSGD